MLEKTKCGAKTMAAPPSLQAVGQNALHQMLGDAYPPPFVQSYVASVDRRTRETTTHTEEFYPLKFATDGSLRDNLRFALKNEPLDLRIIYAALQAIGAGELAEWVRSEPTSIFSRRAWFLYEYFSGETLDLPDARANIPYTSVLAESLHYTAASINVRRHRIRNNLLGSPDLCPVVRRTAKLEAMIASRMSEQVAGLGRQYPPETLARAVNFLYTKETRSSFAIEGEAPNRTREERFVLALQNVQDFDATSKGALVALQGSIVDPRYAATDWRDFQNFVGETTRDYGEKVHFVCPRPDDVPALMQGWMEMAKAVLESPRLDPVLAATVTAFAFVFIHPFEDGNGRIHRFLIHQVLRKRGFTPPGFIFPISAAILRERYLYDQVLEIFSKAIQPAINWSFTEDHQVLVHNHTRDLYRFFDATPQAEYLYERVEETIRTDFKEELDFLTVFDAAFTALQNIVDMPDRRAQLLLRLCLQNNGCLSRKRRNDFYELTDDEIARIEEAIANILRESVEGKPSLP